MKKLLLTIAFIALSLNVYADNITKKDVQELTQEVMTFLKIDKEVPDFELSYDWSKIPALTQWQIDMKYKGIELEALYSIYDNTMYIRPNCRPGILGHEVTHVILTRCYCEPLPEYVQEIVAGYVEYKLFYKKLNQKGSRG